MSCARLVVIVVVVVVVVVVSVVTVVLDVAHNVVVALLVVIAVMAMMGIGGGVTLKSLSILMDFRSDLLMFSTIRSKGIDAKTSIISQLFA
jgi:hypothetical protein